MRKKAIFFVCASFLLWLGCSRETPHISVRVTPDRQEVIPGQALELKFEFTTDANFTGIPYDGYVFVHFIDPLGNQAFVADHRPPRDTSQWKANEAISYSRLIFIPDFVYPGEYQIEVGIYDFEGRHDRIPLHGEDVGHRAYRVARFRVLPPPPYPQVRYLEGWHDAEVNPNEPTQRWRWTKKRAVAALINPARDSRLYLELEANLDVFPDQPQRVTLRLNGQELDQFVLNERGPQLKVYDVSAEQLGADEEVLFEIEVNRTFVPALKGLGPDQRELGIRVYHLVLQPRTPS